MKKVIALGAVISGLMLSGCAVVPAYQVQPVYGAPVYMPAPVRTAPVYYYPRPHYYRY